MMMISVIIPCYNAELFVGRAIKSVFNQTYQQWELILVDNNSNDNTKAVLESYRVQYPDKIKILEQPIKGGAAARNRGLHEAKGAWIQFLDADDEILPNKLGRQAKLILVDGPQLVVGNFYRVVKVKGLNLRISKTPNSKNIWHGLITARLGITSANLWEKNAVLAVSGWDQTLSSSQEYDLIFRMLKKNAKVIFDVTKTSALIHYESNSITRNKSKEKGIEAANNYIALRLSIKDYLMDNGKLDSATSTLINLYIYSYLSDKRRQIPEYVDEKLKLLSIRLSFRNKFAQLIKSYTKKMIFHLSN